MRLLFYCITLFILCISTTAYAAPAPPDTAKNAAVADTIPGEIPDPFGWGDFTWLNGNDRRHTALLDSKYFTGEFLLDANYMYSNQHPIDNTNIGSTAIARANELEISDVAVGGDFHYDNVRGRLLLQLGTRATVVPRNDLSTYKGQYDLANAYRYFSEAYGGYHFDAWHGINVDAGIFMSYVGLFSYYNAENWMYQPSFTSDNTPWFFNGVRIQTFPSDRVKVELWLINGWQSYAKFNNGPGIGVQFTWRPMEAFQLVSNNYYGTDDQDAHERIRFHTDNSIEVRYHNDSSSFIDKAAFSVTQDLGFESGDGVSPFGGNGLPAQNFISGMVYHRIWMHNDHYAWTFGGGYIHNPGRYLVLYPTGQASPIPPVGSYPFTANPGDQFDGWDCSTGFDWMPDEYIDWHIEVVHRESSVPYFAGPGGVTSPDGFTTTPLPQDWKPDLVTAETQIVAALLVRF
ncbi:MAG TPA: outer membrane beta-barrel protein [Candidatus Kapabacteria bacterium]|nr:outer membrane beta-barrel protein [Candidatus Kapabacteria bacterium]